MQGPAIPFNIARLAAAVGELLAHFVITIVTVLTIAATGLVLYELGLDKRCIPWTHIQFGDWMLFMEIVSATAINLVGAARAVLAYGKA